MVTGAEKDFEAFVVARFAELHAVAAVTTGDCVAAAQMTATALALLADRWPELTTASTPTATARSAVLTLALATTSSASATTDIAVNPTLHDRPDGVSAEAALAAALDAAPATARAALAAAHYWDEPPDLVAACAATDPATVQADLASLRDALAQAHADAVGRPPDELAWALPAAVADALEREADPAPVLDPLDVVAAARLRNTRRRRTRVVAVTAAAMLAVSAATALAWPRPVPGALAPTLPPDAQEWAAITSWVPRGPLVGDPAVTAVAGSQGGDPAAHLLYAGTVGDTFVVLMTGTRLYALPAGVRDAGFPPLPDMARVSLQLWTAPTHRGTSAMTRATIQGSGAAASSDVIALSISQATAGAAPVVLVLTKPTITTGFAKTGARPDPDGNVQRVVQSLTFADGVATFTETPGHPSQVVVGDFSGPPTGTLDNDDPLPARGAPEDFAAAQRALLAAVTGYPTDMLRTPLALDAVVQLPNPDTAMLGTDPGPVHVTIATTLTPAGGWARTARLSATNPEGGWRYVERLAAVPADDHFHALLPVGDRRQPTFVALAPDAATAVLVTTTGQVRDTARVKDGMAVLTSTKDPTTTTFRLRLLAPDGHTLYDQAPPTGTEF